MSRKWKWALILSLVVGVPALLAVPAVSWWRASSAQRFTTVTVTRGRVESVVNSTGTVKPVRSVVVGAFVSGPIAEIFVDFNSIVKKDELMAKIDPRIPAAAVERDRAVLRTAKAELARVEALLQQAINNEERARKLQKVNQDYLSGTEMDQYRFTKLSLDAQKQLAEAQISQAEATLKNSEASLSYTDIKAPADGVVIERKVDPGQTVAASFQTPELFIVAPEMDKHMHVYASVDEADIGLIRSAQDEGKPVKFTVDAYPGDLFSGRIVQVRNSSSTNQNVVTYPVLIEAANPDMKLMPGMTANISFQIDAKEDVLRLPAAAIRFVPTPQQVRPEDRHHLDSVGTANPQESPMLRSATEKVEMARKRHQRVVWVKDGKLLRAVPVTLGLIENQFAEIVSADLAEGQKVVTGTKSAAEAGPADDD